MKDEILLNKLKKNSVLFLLTTSKELPAFYYQLKEHLSQVGINLLPLQESGFYMLPKDHHWQILSYRNDFSSADKQIRFIQKYCENSFLSGRLHLIDVTSFSSLKEMTFAQKFFRYKKNYYSYIPLPISVEHLAQEICVKFFKYDEQSKKDQQFTSWPKMPSFRMN